MSAYSVSCLFSMPSTSSKGPMVAHFYRHCYCSLPRPVDHFSKSVHYISKCPSALKTAFFNQLRHRNVTFRGCFWTTAFAQPLRKSILLCPQSRFTFEDVTVCGAVLVVDCSGVPPGLRKVITTAALWLLHCTLVVTKGSPSTKWNWSSLLQNTSDAMWLTKSLIHWAFVSVCW